MTARVLFKKMKADVIGATSELQAILLGHLEPLRLRKWRDAGLLIARSWMYCRRRTQGRLELAGMRAKMQIAANRIRRAWLR